MFALTSLLDDEYKRSFFESVGRKHGFYGEFSDNPNAETIKTVNSLKWQPRHISNELKKPLEGWFCIKKIGEFPILFQIKIQYAETPDGKVSDSPEMYLLCLSLRGHKATAEDKKNIWFSADELNGYVFSPLRFARAFLNLAMAKKYAAQMFNSIFSIISPYVNYRRH